MRRITLTEAQRRAVRFEKKSETLADGLSKYKRDNGLNNESLSDALGLSRPTVSKLLRKEQGVSLPVETMWLMLELADIKMTQKKPEDV